MSCRLIVLVLLLGACTSTPGLDGTTPSSPTVTGAPTSSAAAVPAPGDVAPERLAPLAGLGPCPDVPAPPDGVEVPAGLPLPQEAVVSSAEEAGGLVSLQGYVPRTPVEVLVDYLDVTGWEILQAEDEVFESEVLLGDGDRRFYVKTQAVCERGSALVGFVGRDAAVPTPTGAATP